MKSKISWNHVIMATCIIGGVLFVYAAPRENMILVVIAGALMAPAFVVAFRPRL